MSPESARDDGRKTRATRSSSLVQRVHTTILEDVMAGRLKPGTVIAVPEIAARCKTSRTPVREALTVLSHEGVVTAVPNKGYFVREVSPADVKDVFFMRRIIEPAAAEIAAETMDDDEIDRLRQEMALHLPEPTMTLAYDEHSHDFHRTIIGATRSPRLVTTFEGIYTDVRRFQSATIGMPRPDLVHAEHTAILDAIARRDHGATRSLMEEHIGAIRLRALEAWVDLGS